MLVVDKEERATGVSIRYEVMSAVCDVLAVVSYCRRLSRTGRRRRWG